MIIRSKIIVDIYDISNLSYGIAMIIMNYIGYFSHVSNTF